MKNRYFLMRHGESEANRKNLIISEPEIGCHVYGLTAKGREQARSSIKQSGLDSRTIVICSDFLRTVETAEVVRETIRTQPPTVERGLRERYFGKLEGASGDRYKEVWARDSKDSVQTLYGAESPRHLALRLKKTMARIEEEHLGQTILLVSHGDPLRFLQLAVAERDLTEHMEVALFKPAEVRAIEHMPRSR